jgi:hypothetical protein
LYFPLRIGCIRKDLSVSELGFHGGKKQLDWIELRAVRGKVN